MLIRKSQATVIPVNKQSVILDYDLNSEQTGISYQHLTGTFPEEGWSVNTVCKEIIFIISGTGTFTIEGETFAVQTGDVIVLPPGKKHKATYQDVTLITFTDPDWYEEQCEAVA